MPPEPQNKQELLTIIQDQRRQLEELLAQLDAGQMTTAVIDHDWTVKDTLAHIVAGKQDVERFIGSDLPTRELRHELLRLKGVGPYAAANLLMLLGRYDHIPVDSRALKVVSHEWYDGQEVSAQEVEERFASWGKWKGLAYWFWDWDYNKQGGPVRL